MVVKNRKFALAFEYIDNQLRFKSKNDGMSIGDIILVLEAYAEKMKEDYKKPIKDSLLFQKDEKDI